MSNRGSSMSDVAADAVYVPDAQTIEILAALSKGRNKVEAAGSCHVSGRTMRRKLADLRTAWDVDSNVEAVVTAVRRGLI